MPTITLPPGHVNLKGPQAPNAVNHWFSLSGAVTLAGLVLTVVVASGEIAIPAGAIAFQGLAPTVREGDRQFDIPAGSLVLKGPQRPQVVPALGVGQLPLTGYAPVAAVDTPGAAIAMSAGVVAMQGYAPLRITAVLRDIPAGTLTLAGQYVAVAFKQPDVGRLIYTGLAPTVIATSQVGIPIPVGSIALRSDAPTCHLSVAIPAGQLVIAAPLMNVAATGLIAVPAGALTFTGTETTAHLVWTIPAGSLVLTGPALAPGHTLPIGAGALGLTGTAVDLSGVHVVAMPAGALAFSGPVLTVLRPIPVVHEIEGRGSFKRVIRGRGSYTPTIRGRGAV